MLSERIIFLVSLLMVERKFVSQDLFGEKILFNFKSTGARSFDSFVIIFDPSFPQQNIFILIFSRRVAQL